MLKCKLISFSAFSNVVFLTEHVSVKRAVVQRPCYNQKTRELWTGSEVHGPAAIWLNALRIKMSGLLYLTSLRQTIPLAAAVRCPLNKLLANAFKRWATWLVWAICTYVWTVQSDHDMSGKSWSGVGECVNYKGVCVVLNSQERIETAPSFFTSKHNTSRC